MKQVKKASSSNRAFYLLAAALGVAGVVALTYQSTRPKGVDRANPVDTTLPPVQSEGYVMGSESAPIEVVEFGDFECPQCGRFATLTEHDVRVRLINTGMMRYRYIDYPLPMHGNTWNASRAAACADEQGKFWEMHDAIYANQDRWNTEATNKPDKLLKQIGGQIPGINADQFNQCVDTKKTQAKIQAHLKIAESRHVSATPSFAFGTDKQTDGFLTYDQFKQFVTLAIAKSGKPFPGLSDTAKKNRSAHADEERRMTKRQLMALISIAGLFLGAYLTLYKFGFIGELACNVGSCEKVQTSRWSVFLGLPVATWGLLFYVLMLALTIASMQERFADSRRLALAMLLLAGWGALFTAWLNYLEAFVINAWCEWCLGSAAMVLLLVVLAWLNWRETRDGAFAADEIADEAPSATRA